MGTYQVKKNHQTEFGTSKSLRYIAILEPVTLSSQRAIDFQQRTASKFIKFFSLHGVASIGA